MKGDYRNGNNHGIEKEIAIPAEKNLSKWSNEEVGLQNRGLC